MVYKVVESECGPYVSHDGIFCDIMEAINVMTPQGRNVGWSEYENIEEASAAFNLIYIGIREVHEEQIEDEE